MKIHAILACRMYSERMYGKPMKIIEDKPIIEHVIDRLSTSQMINDIILAISEKEENMVFVDFAQKNNLKFIQGDEEDVLGRILEAAKNYGTDYIVRTTVENPLVYIDEIDDLIKFHIENNCDLTYFGKLPIGCGVEVISFEALEKSFNLGQEKHHSELVSLFINENPQMFKIKRFDVPSKLQKDNYRLTVDTPIDLKLMRIIYNKFYKKNSTIKLNDVIEFLDKNPDIVNMNIDIPIGNSRIWE